MNSLLVTVLVALFVIAESCRNGQQQLPRKHLDRSQQQKIVDLHNSLRNKVASGRVRTQAKAQNMRELSWDPELAAQAQKWADNCEMKHDPNRKNSKGEYVGQNLFMGFGWAIDLQSSDFDSMVNSWFNEVYENGYKNDGTFQYSSGHYSQMIWADTSRVGCGYSEFKEGQTSTVLFVCNYYKAGNVLGQKAYQPGRRNCQKFNLTNSQKYSSLCGE